MGGARWPVNRFHNAARSFGDTKTAENTAESGFKTIICEFHASL